MVKLVGYTVVGSDCRIEYPVFDDGGVTYKAKNRNWNLSDSSTYEKVGANDNSWCRLEEKEIEEGSRVFVFSKVFCSYAKKYCKTWIPSGWTKTSYGEAIYVGKTVKLKSVLNVPDSDLNGWGNICELCMFCLQSDILTSIVKDNTVRLESALVALGSFNAEDLIKKGARNDYYAYLTYGWKFLKNEDKVNFYGLLYDGDVADATRKLEHSVQLRKKSINDRYSVLLSLLGIVLVILAAVFSMMREGTAYWMIISLALLIFSGVVLVEANIKYYESKKVR